MAANHLAGETSPYLLQHAGNPVDWYPWGEEALACARREDKPIFLSIGYSACHWCHVMAHESFEDPATARILNRHFVSIKVDREERPDLDALYMRAVLLQRGQGGWPLTVFLTPGLQPFFGGTYFPREARFGMSSFQDVLRAVAEAYAGKRGEVEASARELMEAVARSFDAPRGGGTAGPETAEAARRVILSRFDSSEGGFGVGPKFPQPPLLEFLLDESLRTRAPALAGKVFFTLRKMADGGVRDQVGGGFHRYSVDGAWRVPHYEKMLYDNAQLASLYFRAFSWTGDAEFRRVGGEVLSDVRRAMAAPGGGFVAALDADSEGEEGRFYLWGRRELEAVLGREEAAVAGSFLGVAGDGASLEERTPRRVQSWAEGARAAGLPEAEFRSRVAAALSRLREAREARAHPGADTKVLTDWNALAANAFLGAYLATSDPAHREAGARLLDLLWSRCWDGGRLFHVWDGASARVKGFLADYAYLAAAWWRAFEATGGPDHLARCEVLIRTALVRFRDQEGRLFDTPAGERPGDLLLPVRDTDDGVLPSALAVLAGLLWKWERLTGDEAIRRALDDLLKLESGALRQSPGSMPLLAELAAARAAPPVDLVVAAGSEEAARPLLAVARGVPAAHALVLPLLADRVSAEQAGRYALFAGRRTERGSRAYLCVGGACRLPVESPAQLEELFRADLGDRGSGPEN